MHHTCKRISTSINKTARRKKLQIYDCTKSTVSQIDRNQHPTIGKAVHNSIRFAEAQLKSKSSRQAKRHLKCLQDSRRILHRGEPFSLGQNTLWKEYRVLKPDMKRYHDQVNSWQFIFFKVSPSCLFCTSISLQKSSKMTPRYTHICLTHGRDMLPMATNLTRVNS